VAQRKKLLLRIPETLWVEIKRRADVELRSVNGQIEFMLQRTVDASGSPPPTGGEEE
jgi:hypothetical protein